MSASNVDTVTSRHMPGHLARYAAALGVDRGWCGYGGRLFASPCANTSCTMKGHGSRENLRTSAERLEAMRSIGFVQFGQDGAPVRGVT